MLMAPRSTLVSLLLWAGSLLAPALAVAHPAGAPGLPTARAIRTAQAPVIDGSLDDRAWEAAPPQQRFTQSFPTEGAPPTERTEVRFLYDDHAVYVAIRAFDSSPEKIAAPVTRRDGSPE